MTSITKTTPEIHVGLFTLFAAMVAKVRTAVEAQVPVGYEDEFGFHTGNEPRYLEADYRSNQ